MERDGRSKSTMGKREQMMYRVYLTIAGADSAAAESEENPGAVIGQSNTYKRNTIKDENKDNVNTPRIKCNSHNNLIFSKICH